MKKFIVILISVLLLFALVSCDGLGGKTPTEGLEYTLLSDGTYEVTGIGTATDLDVVIPTTYDGIRVTSVGARAFKGDHSIKSVTVADGITAIGDGAFSECISLTRITLPNTLSVLGNGVFLGCSSLSYSEKDGARYLGSSKNPHLVLISLSDLTAGAVEVNKKTEFISSDAFFLASSLKSVTLPKGLRSIGTGAFRGCSSLESIELPSGITCVSPETFAGCASLVSVSIPEGTLTVGASAFEGCASLTEVSLPSTLKNIESFAFSGCSSLKTVYIPSATDSVGAYAFGGCTSLTSVDCGAAAMPDGWAVDWLGDTATSVNYGKTKN